jgi:hypothetical protein
MIAPGGNGFGSGGDFGLGIELGDRLRQRPAALGDLTTSLSGFAAPNNTTLSNALRFELQP